MTQITRAMRSYLACDESNRALDPSAVNLRAPARLPPATRARSPGNALMVADGAAPSGTNGSTARPTRRASRGSIDRPLPRPHGRQVALVEASGPTVDEPTPYVRPVFPVGLRLPQAMRGFA